jgi:acetyl/propionyl-CoA carboxylase alpha subunit
VSAGGRCGAAIYHLGDQTAKISETAQGMCVQIAGDPQQDFIHINLLSDRLTFEQGGQRHDVGIARVGTEILVSGDLGRFRISVKNAEEALLSQSRNAGIGAHEIRAPMPGLVANVLQAAGAQVKAGDPVIVIEAMKLLQTLNAPCDATLDAVHYSAGDIVEKHALLATFTPEETPQ